MKRLHVHVGVEDLSASVTFYSALFGAQPIRLEADHAKWMMDDPRMNFAISTRTGRSGVDHLGIQVEDADELRALREQVSRARILTRSDGETTCCYARSEKSWLQDPDGLAWEAYHTMAEVSVLAGRSAPATASCCTPETPQGACCSPEPGLAAQAPRGGVRE